MNNYSFSITKGKGNQKHNNRTQSIVAAHIDQERIKDNLILIDKDIREVYNSLFGEALEKYNAKQKRNDRKIKDYYSKIVHSKKEKAFHELIIQLGDYSNHPSNEIAEKIYQEFVEEFQKKNPQMEVIGAYIHLDEATPHLHLDYVPFVDGAKKGLNRKISNDGAIKQMGYESWLDWREAQFELFRGVAKRFDIIQWNMDNHEKHLNTAEFKRYHQKLLNIQEEINVATKQKMKFKQANTKLNQTNTELEQAIETKKNELNSLEKKKNELNSVLEQEKKEYFTLKKKNLLFRIIDSIEWIKDEFIQWFNDEIYKWLDEDIQEKVDELDEEIQNDKDDYSL